MSPMKITFLCALLALSFHSFADPDSVCGKDDRVPHTDPKIARLSINGEPGCTVTMIGKTCAISAGHCVPLMPEGLVEFNLPSQPQDVYKIDITSLKSQDLGPGLDWAVFKILPNSLTGKKPGVLYGTYPYSFEGYVDGEEIQIAGYGIDKRENRNATLQIAYGRVTDVAEVTHGSGVFTNALYHDVDTEGGNSGSAIIRLKTNDIIGVHTHGTHSCRLDDNKGTLISENKRFRDALKNCLENDK